MAVLEQAYKEYAQGLAANRPRNHTYFPVMDERFPGFQFRFKSQEGGNVSSGVWALRITSDMAGVEVLVLRRPFGGVSSQPNGEASKLNFQRRVAVGSDGAAWRVTPNSDQPAAKNRLPSHFQVERVRQDMRGVNQPLRPATNPKNQKWSGSAPALGVVPVHFTLRLTLSSFSPVSPQ